MQDFPLEMQVFPCRVDLSVLSKDHTQECQTGLITSRSADMMWLTGCQVCGKSLTSTWDSGDPQVGAVAEEVCCFLVLLHNHRRPRLSVLPRCVWGEERSKPGLYV